jgi:hypothetical protein
MLSDNMLLSDNNFKKHNVKKILLSDKMLSDNIKLLAENIMLSDNTFSDSIMLSDKIVFVFFENVTHCKANDGRNSNILQLKMSANHGCHRQ